MNRLIRATLTAILLSTAVARAQADKSTEPKEATAPIITIADHETSKKLGLLENWRPSKGKWTQERAGRVEGATRAFETDGIRGAGDSSAFFQEKLPADFRLEFTLNVVDGMRPRMFFEGGLFLGNEGFEKDLFAYGDGISDVRGKKAPYKNGQPVTIRADLWGEDFAFYADGKLFCSGKRRLPKDGTQLLFQGGDWWSQGTCIFAKFSLRTKP